MKHNNDIPEDFSGIVDRLHAHRADITPLELDRIKRLSRERAVGKGRIHIKREERIFMKTRATVLGVLAGGMVLSFSGAAMGVSGLAGSDSASQVQYQVNVKPGKPTVLGASAVRPASGTAPTAQTAPAVAQPSAQQGLEDSGSLPFTGYAAIPVLLLGLGLLGTGFVMRRRTRLDS
ncbi:MAG: hypothetical protein ACJ762_01775 [Solirubrobacteraceae bacterium]